MLLCTKSHFIKDLDAVLEGQEGPGSDEEKKGTGKAMKERITEYATDASGKKPLVEVWSWRSKDSDAPFTKKVDGQAPRPGQRVVYVDGGFDLFSTGHIEFLQQVVKTEEQAAKQKGWNADYRPVYVVAGIHSDESINDYKGINYPIMNIFERGLCVLQCKVCFPAIITSLILETNKLYSTYRLSSSPPLQSPTSNSSLPFPTL